MSDISKRATKYYTMSNDLAKWLPVHYTALEVEFLETLVLCQHRPAKKLVHQLRLNAKQQLAFFKLIKDLLPAEMLDHQVTTIRTFQKRLGKLRNAQIQRQKAKAIEQTLTLEPTVSKQFRRRSKKYAATRKADGQAAEVVNAMQVLRVHLNELAPRLEADQLVGHLKAQVQHWLFEGQGLANLAQFDTAKFHELRTCLKQLLYALAWLQPFFRNLPFSNTATADARQVESALGEWHDYVVLAKKVDAADHPAFTSVLQEQIERNTYEVRERLPLLEGWLRQLEVYFAKAAAS